MDMGASVIARLKNKAKETGKPFQLHLQLFCQEEFLRRLAASCYAENLVLKGGLFIYTLTNFESRATVDIDFLLQQFPGRIEDMKDERVEAAKEYHRTIPAFTGDKAGMVEAIRQALYASKIISYAQGYTLMRTAAKTYGWNLNYGGIALMWRGGCIIRSVFLGKIKEAYDKNPELSNLLLDPYFKRTIENLIPAWRKVATAAVQYGVPAPAMTAALSYFDGYTTERLPANLLQAQRDYFGAHTYERLDSPRGQFVHTNWTGHGGDTAASTYNA